MYLEMINLNAYYNFKGLELALYADYNITVD